MPPYTNKAAVRSAIIGGKVLTFMGFLLVALFTFAMLVTVFSAEMPLDTKTTGYITSSAMICVGILFIRGGRSIKRRVRRFHSYAFLLSSEVTTLQQIAENTYTSYDFVKRDMGRMIRRGYFTGISLDVLAGRVRFFSGQSPPLYTPPRLQPPGCSVHCPGCGAVNSVTPGVAKQCEYCGTFLKN